jgi:WD40 repeat protein
MMRALQAIRPSGRLAVAAVALVHLISSPARGQDSAGFQLVTPEGHSSSINAILFSADGRLVVTAGSDGTARLWEAATGREIRAFRGHTGSVNSAAFSPDGKQVVTASDDGALRLWDVATGRMLHRLSAHRGGTLAALFSPDGRLLASAGRDSTARVWDLGDWSQLHEFKNDSGAVHDLGFSSDGRYLATAWGRSTTIWDPTFGRQVQALPPQGHDVNRVEFSPDGRRLLTVSGDEGVIRIWDLVRARVLQTLQVSGVVLRSAAFCGGNERVVGSGNDGRSRVWNVASAEVETTLETTGERAGVSRCSSDGKLVGFGGAGGTGRVWESASGNPSALLRGHGLRSLGGAVSPNGRYAALIGGDTAVYVWDVAGGRAVATLRGHTAPITAIAFSPDGLTLATGSLDSTARIWDAATGTSRHTLKGHLGMVFSLSWSPDGKTMVSLGADRSARVWDALSGGEIGVLPSDGWSSARFSGDGRSLLSLSRDGVRFWEVATRRMVRHAPVDSVRQVALSPDGLLVRVNSDGSAGIQDPASGRIRTLADPPAPVGSIVFSPDGRRVFLTGIDGTVAAWELSTGRKVAAFSAGAGGVLRVLGVLDGNRVMTSRGDGTASLWNTGTGEELLRRYLLAGGEWVAVTPRGQFEGTEAGIARLHYARGLETAPLEAFFDRYYAPGLTQGVMRGDAPRRNLDVRRESARRPTVTLVSPVDGDTLSRRTTVVVKTVDQGGGIEDVRLYHNGALVGGTAMGLAVQEAGCPAEATCFRIPLVTGSNLLEVTAYSRDRVEAERDSAVVLYTTTGSLPTLHILAFGINTYQNSNYNLNYGRADAAALVASIESGAGAIYRGRIVVDTLFDRAVTAEAIREKLAQVAARARPEDVFVLFYAGHGALGQIGDSTQFFLVPTDITQLSDTAQLLSLGISHFELHRLIARIPARKKLMLIDACHSGELMAAFTTRGPAEERALAQLARSTGIFVMSATESEQFASEVTALGHGVFTYALLQVMAAREGDPRRERMTGEIVSQAARMIPELSQTHRAKPQYPVVFSSGQDFPLVVR